MKENGKCNFDIKFVITTWGCILILENNEREKISKFKIFISTVRACHEIFSLIGDNFMILGISSQRVGGVI
jgi:hypothetical protein